MALSGLPEPPLEIAGRTSALLAATNLGVEHPDLTGEAMFPFDQLRSLRPASPAP